MSLFSLEKEMSLYLLRNVSQIVNVVLVWAVIIIIDVQD